MKRMPYFIRRWQPETSETALAYIWDRIRFTFADRLPWLLWRRRRRDRKEISDQQGEASGPQ